MEIFIAKFHLHPIIDRFTIALCTVGVLADLAGYGLPAVFGSESAFAAGLASRLRNAAPVLLTPGALSAILSRFTGESEAGRVWDSISPAAQQVLLSDERARWLLSHAVLGTYLMYALLGLAAWRMLIEISAGIRHTRLL